MNLRHLVLDRERELDDMVIEISATLHPDLSERSRWRTGSISNTDVTEIMFSKLFLLGQAFQTLRELRKIGPNMFILTNDGPEGRSFPGDDFASPIPQETWKRLSWRPVRRGFGADGEFESNLDFDNFVIQIPGGDFSDFLEDFLGGHLHPIRYWFLFASDETQIFDIERAVLASSDSRELTRSLCNLSALAAYGFEVSYYVFATSNHGVLAMLRDSFGSKP